jgi:hypothetical protein
MKFFHNTTVDRAINFFIVIGTHAIFALGMFFLGRFLGSLVLRDIPNGADIFGIVLAWVMFISAMKVFVFMEYTKDDIKAYETKNIESSFMPALTESQKIVAGMEISSLLYRCWMTLPNYVGAGITLALGLLLLRHAYNMGKIMHAQANRPASVDAKLLREKAAKEVYKGGGGLLGKLSLAQKRLVAAGDPQPLDEVQSEQEHTHWWNIKKKQLQADDAAKTAQKKEQDWKDQYQKDEEFSQKFLAPKGSSNGASPK